MKTPVKALLFVGALALVPLVLAAPASANFVGVHVGGVHVGLGVGHRHHWHHRRVCHWHHGYRHCYWR